MTNSLNIEQARILTISTEHLHPDTIHAIENKTEVPFDIPLSIAIRDEGFLVNSLLGCEEKDDLLPSELSDLNLILKLAQSLGAEWVNIDRDGVVYSDILPTYDDDGALIMPTTSQIVDLLGHPIVPIRNHQDAILIGIAGWQTGTAA